MDIDTSTLFAPLVANGDAHKGRQSAARAKRITATKPNRAIEALTRGHEFFGPSECDAGRKWGLLMTAAQSGQGPSYRCLLDLLKPWLEDYYRHRLPMVVVADAVRETLIAIHEKRHTYDTERPFELWLSAIARYKWIDRLRAMERGQGDTLVENPMVREHHGAATSPSIFESLLATLKPDQRQVIRLVKLDGLTIGQAAVRSGQSVFLVKVNIHYGLKNLVAAAERY